MNANSIDKYFLERKGNSPIGASHVFGFGLERYLMQNRNCSEKKTDKFLEWVGKNYGQEVRSRVKATLGQDPCNSRSILFGKLFQILGEEEVKGMKSTINFGDIQYNSS